MYTSSISHLTDDADRMPYGCDEFGPADDYDPMYEGFGDEPKCGGCWRDNGNGCRHCSPVDFEAINTGCEIYDNPEFYRVRNELWMLAYLGYALDPSGRENPAGRAYLERAIGYNRKMNHAVHHKLWQICDRAETHGQAVAEFEAWKAQHRIGI